jgi:hypothetical protein
MTKFTPHLVLISLVIASSSVNADQNNECNIWKVKAQNYMKLRQENVPLAQAMKSLSGNRSRGLFLQAYQQPIVDGMEAKSEAINSFAETIYSECISISQ